LRAEVLSLQKSEAKIVDRHCNTERYNITLFYRDVRDNTEGDIGIVIDTTTE
jgi:hypothetical protein